MDTVVKSRESSRVLDCSSQSPGSCDSSSVCLTDDEQTGNYSGPEVGFEEVAIVFPQARFWTACQLSEQTNHRHGLRRGS